MLISIGTLRKLVNITLNERRKNEEEDQRYLQAISSLENLAKENRYFIHYTDDYNLRGINPRVSFKTPVGIYTYPLTKENSDNVTKGKMPYAQNRKWIIVYECKNIDKLLIVSQYSWKDFESDAVKLGFDPEKVKSEKLSTNQPASALMWCLYDGIFDNVNNIGYDGEEYDQHGIKVNVMQIKQNNSKSILASKLLLNLGYVGIYDDIGAGVVHPNEPTQAFFVSSKFLNVVDIVRNPTMMLYYTWVNDKRGKYYTQHLKNQELDWREQMDTENVLKFRSLPKIKQIDLIKQRPSVIGFMENPSEELQMLAVKNEPLVIKYIKNPTEKVKNFAEEEYQKKYSSK